VVALQPAAASFGPAFDESFVDNRNKWPSDPNSAATLLDGTYRLVARRPGQFVALGAPVTQSFRDVVVSAAFRKLGGPAGGGYGIIVRDQGPGPRDGLNQDGWYYVFEAGDRGEVGIWRRDGDRWVDLVSWNKSEAVLPGAGANELSVQAMGQRLTFTINGTEVARVEDTALPEGTVGIFVGGDFNEVALERFRIEVPN